MIRILLAASLDSRSIELLSEVPEFEIRVMPGLDGERLLEEVRAADALVCPGPLPAIGKLLEAGRDLKLVVQAGGSAGAGEAPPNVEIRRIPAGSQAGAEAIATLKDFFNV